MLNVDFLLRIYIKLKYVACVWLRCMSPKFQKMTNDSMLMICICISKVNNITMKLHFGHFMFRSNVLALYILNEISSQTILFKYMEIFLTILMN